MLGSKPSNTSIEPRKKVKNNINPVEKRQILEISWKNNLPISHAKLDIAFTITMVSQHMHSPKEIHLEAVYKILRYLKSSLRRGLFLKKSEGREI